MAAPRLLDYAVDTERAGDLETAERLYRALAADLPEDAGLAVRLGLCIHRSGRTGEALAWLARAVALTPGDAEVLGLLGTALGLAGRHGEAGTAFGHCVAIAPGRAENHLCLGNARKDQGRPEEAAQAYRQACLLAPDLAEAHFLRAVALQAAGNGGRAGAAYRTAIAFDPGLGKSYANLGLCLAEGGQVEALASFCRAAAVTPDDARPHANRGNLLQRLERMEEALAAYDAAVSADAQNAEARYNRGTLLSRLDRDKEAEAAYREAVCLAPGFAKAHSNLGVSLYRQARPGPSVAAHRRAVCLDPANAEGHFNLSHSLLLAGALEEGFAEWEWRWRVADFPSPRRNFPQPAWDGTPFPGRTLLVHAEQGHGDSLQFCRYLPLVAALGGRLVLECAAPLAGLLRQIPGVETVVESGRPLPPFDVHAPLLSLPRLCGTATDGEIPAQLPYLRAPAERLEAWRPVIGDDRRMKVGVVWAGNPRHGDDRHRSLPVTALQRLRWPEGVTLYSLQKGVAEGGWQGGGGAPAVTELGRSMADFADLAAAVTLLDLVISVDTAAAHMAGALGRPVWTLLPFAPDWRWRLEREDTPWYPTMRLFRQRCPGDWAEVLQRIGAELAAAVARQELQSEPGKNGRMVSVAGAKPRKIKAYPIGPEIA